ncbi:MAG TPA: prepilin-type N-terminal cleavage/methylation domain-containing protein [Pirellulales bacterium]|nr:prepilin-type N-terminal cleavage/methylation domain-containing protein [Pirellulales bacterium]
MPGLAKASGFSLLEVVLALAILTASVAVLGELIRTGLRNAQTARDLSQAVLLCESILQQIESGQLPSQSAGQSPVPEVPGWLYSIEPSSMPTSGAGGGSQSGLLTLRVTVEQSREQQARPVRCILVRWLRDPSLVLAQQSAEQSLPSSTGNSTSSTSSTMLGTGVY